MSQTPDNTQQLPPEEYHDEDEINLLDLLIVILKRKGMIFKIVTTVFFLSIIISLLLAKSYVATAKILPPQEKGSPMSGLLSQVGGAFGGLASGILGGGGSSSDMYVGILKSRSVADDLIKKYDLMNVFDTKSMSQIYSKLSGMSFFSVDKKSQIITISVEDRDPEMAASLANGYIEALDIINRNVNITEGQRKRIFLETRLTKVKEDLIKAETDLKNFQEKYKLISLDAQAKVAIEGAAAIKAEIINAETELEVLKGGFGTSKQNEAVMLQSKIDELKKQLSKIESGGANNELYIPINALPELGIQLARLMREFKIQESVFELLTSQYEMAKIEEAKDMNTIQVLDKAVPPDKKAKPKRSLIVILSTFVAFFFSLFNAFFLEFVEKIKAEDGERYNTLLEYIRGIRFGKYTSNIKKYGEHLKGRIKKRPGDNDNKMP